MKLTHILAATLVMCAALVARPALAADENSDVLVLTKDNYKDIINPEKLMLVEYYAPWCGHCQKLAPHYEKAATTLKAEGIKLAKVDCTEHATVCSEQNVQGYPTMKVFRDGKASDYGGGREEDTIVRYMRKQAMPALSNVADDKIDTFTKSDRFVVLAYLPSGSDTARAAVQALADKHRDDYTLGFVTTAAGAKALGVPEGNPAVVAFRQFDEPRVAYSGDIDSDKLSAWAKVESVPTMDDVTPDNYMRYVDADLPLVFFFYDTEDQRKTIGPRIEKVAKTYKGKINFVYTDAGKFGAHAENLALKVGTWPALAVNNIKKGLKWPFSQEKELTEEVVRSFIDDFAAGKLEPHLKSAEIPEKQENAVFTLVGKQFTEIALDKKKDVFLEVYAPWCGHCKKLAPTWESLAKALKDQNDKIVIAAMDGTENDIPPTDGLEVEGFPTIVLLRAEDNKAIVYDGDRSYEDLVKFIGKEAKNKIKLPEGPPPSEDKEDTKEAGDDESAKSKDDESARDEL